MEILALLRLNAKRLTALATIGALTGALAAAAVSRQPTSYQATTTVFVGQALPSGSTVFDLSPLVADFQEAVQLPQVRQEAADQLGLPVAEVQATTSRTGTDGGSVQVLASSESAELAEQVSQTTASVAMDFLTARQLDRATSLENQRQAEMDEAKATRDRLLTDAGFAEPDTTYRNVLERLNALTLDASDPTKELTNEARAQAAAEAARLRSQLPQLQAAADEYRVASKELEDAEDNLNQARQLRAAAEATQQAATAERAVAPGETIAESQLSIMVQAFAAAVVATFVAGIAFFFAADGARRRGRTPTPVPAATTAAAARMPAGTRNAPASSKPSTASTPASPTSTTAGAGAAPAGGPVAASSGSGTTRSSGSTSPGTSTKNAAGSPGDWSPPAERASIFNRPGTTNGRSTDAGADAPKTAKDATTTPRKGSGPGTPGKGPTDGRRSSGS